MQVLVSFFLKKRTDFLNLPAAWYMNRNHVDLLFLDFVKKQFYPEIMSDISNKGMGNNLIFLIRWICREKSVKWSWINAIELCDHSKLYNQMI